jgi:hypothetical protein
MGWLSKSAAKWGDIAQRGGVKAITDKQRKFFAAVGLPTKKTTINIPSAIFFGPLMHRKRDHMGKVFAKKIQEKIARREAKAKAKG